MSVVWFDTRYLHFSSSTALLICSFTPVDEHKPSEIRGVDRLDYRHPHTALFRQARIAYRAQG